MVVIFCLLILAVIIGLIVSRKILKIPSRGVFVMNGVLTQMIEKQR